MWAWVRLPRRMNLHLTMVSLHLVDGKSVGCAKPYGGKKRIICVIYLGMVQYLGVMEVTDNTADKYMH